LIESTGQGRRGFRGLLLDWQRSDGPSKIAPEAAALSWTMLW